MPRFENKPYSNDDYDKNTEDAENLKKQMTGAKTADEMMAIAMKMKAAEGNEKELMGNAQEEAGKENEERKAYDEAVAEDTERTTAKESEKMDADLENLKGQIVGAKNADEMMEIAGKIKEIEEKKKEIGLGSQKKEAKAETEELEELKLKDETESGKKVEEILKKINGEKIDEKSSEPEQAEKTEGPLDKLKVQYGDVLEKIKIKRDQSQELEKKREELITEKRTVEGTGNQQRLDEINKEFEEIYKQQESVKNGEKLPELRKKQNAEERINDFRDEKEQKQDAKFKEEYLALYKNSKNEDLGLDHLEYKKRELIAEFKKQNGYDGSSLADLGYGAGNTDANRKFMNDYFGTEMPIFSREFKLGKKFQNKDGKELPYVIADNSQEGIYNQSLLAKKQVELWQQATDAMNALEKISKETKQELIKEHKLEYDAVMDSFCINDIYQPFVEVTKEAGQNTGTSAAIIRPNEKFYPEDVKKHANSGYELTQKGLANERWIKNVLFLQKIAKEKGLIE